MVINCILVEDNEMDKMVLEKFIDQSDSIQLLKAFESPDVAINYLHGEHDIDFLFLDLMMPGMTGMEFLQSVSPLPPVIITSSYKDFAVEAYEYDIIDYLVKPYNFARFLKSINKAHKIVERRYKNRTSSKDHVYIKDNKLFHKLFFDEIIWIQANSDFIDIKTKDKTYTIYTTMGKMLNKLDQSTFARVHRSYIVNINKIVNLDDSTLVIGHKTIPISQTYKNDLLNRLNML